MGDAFQRQMGDAFWEKFADLAKGLDVVLPPNLPLPKFRRRDQARAEMRAMLQPLIAERRANPDQYDDFLQDFINNNYKDGSKVEDSVIESMILGLMFAGHETTAGQAAWTIIELLRAPTYLQSVQQEIAEKMPPTTAITTDLLASLTYCEWAVREVERMHPSADMLLRTVEEEIEVGEYRIPPGWMVLVSAAVAHRLPEWFANPEQFDPLRFAPGREEDRQHRFALIGFGGGIHKCTGMNFAYNEMISIIGLLFQQFDVALITPDPHTEFGLGASRPSQTIIRYRRKLAA